MGGIMLKTLSFAVMHFSIAFLVTAWLTGDIMLGGVLALVEPAVNSVAFFFHEKLWSRNRGALAVGLQQSQSAVGA